MKKLLSVFAAAAMLFNEHKDEFDSKLMEELSYTHLYKELLNL